MKATVTSPTLIQAAVDGDTAALSALITASRPDLVCFARRACATPEDAEDAVQETLWIISRQIGTLRMLAAFTAWAARIVKNECYRLLKLARGDSTPLADELPDKVMTVEALTALRQDVIAALSELKPTYRQVIILRDIEGLTAPQVAADLEITIETVKSRLHRARSVLRERLQHWVE